MNHPVSFPTGTVTFLFTDIEGSTKLWEAHPEAMQASLERHDSLMREAIQASGGVVFKTIGDAFCAAFASAPEALTAVMCAQTALAREPWPDETSLRVRMALHTGLAQERDNDYFGPVLNRVARLLSAGHGGQTLVSAATYELVRDVLSGGQDLRDLGLRRLKDLERPEHIFQLVHPDLPADFPPLKTLDSTPNNLPQQLTSFVGREKVTAEVAELLSKTRLLTLLGPGGTGKTRLSLQVAADLLDQYADGVWQVELAPISGPALVPQTVASALGIREQPGHPLQQTLVDALKNKCLLLLLDNTEHVLTACAPLAAALLRACPQVKILVTSREPLGVSGEQVYRVPALSLPTATQARQATPDSLSQFESVRLFVDRALSVKRGFSVTNSNAPALAQLCYRLDGIPLAIELAAARVRSLPVEQINDKLDSRFRLLTGGDRSALPRQQTLRALVDWSYDLLSENEKTLLARLSVFVGGWTLAAAESVCGFDPLEDWEMLDLLTSLVDKSLVVSEEDAGSERYRMLETLRQYASEKADAGGEAELVKERHRDFFQSLVEEAEPKLRGSEQVAWLDRLETEHDNLRAILDGCAAATPGDRLAMLAGLRLSEVLWRFWLARGYLSEGREHLQQMLSSRQAILAAPEHAADPTAKKAVAGILDAAGTLAWNQGDYETARLLHEESRDLYHDLGDKRGIARTLGSLGVVACIQGDYVTGRLRLEENLRLYREIGDKYSISAVLMNLGNVAREQHDYTAAYLLYEESLSLQREGGDKGGIALTLLNLGSVAYYQNDYPAAHLLYEESLSLYRDLGNKHGIALTLERLGSVAWNRGDYPTARLLHEESLTRFREIGDRGGIARGLAGVASVSNRKDEVRRAVVLWAAAEVLRENIGAPLSSDEKPRQDAEIARARAALEEETFARAWAEGAALPWEQAVALALGT